jgi:rare lipoprotein A
MGGLCLLIAGCQTHKPEQDIFKPNGQVKPTQKPYEINSQWYYPIDHYEYDEEGVASWYGPGFHGRATATGAIFDENKPTAAHNTLPLPCMVRVTNLGNGRQVLLEVNDRGPFAKDRLIDVSRRGAQLLGFMAQGTARVRVECLPEESRQLNEHYRKYPPSKKKPKPVTAAKKGKAAAPKLHLDPSFHFDRKAEAALKREEILIQLAMCDKTADAKKIAKKFKTLGTLKVTRAKIHGKYQYRVLVGPISSLKHAEALVKKIAQQGLRGAKIIIKEAGKQ